MGKIHDRFKNKQLKRILPTKIEVEQKAEQLSLGTRLVLTTDAVEAKELMKKAYGRGYEAGSALLKNPTIKSLRGRYDGLCKYTACLTPHGVHWYNRGSNGFYCEDCARMLNRANRDATTAIGEEPLCSFKTETEAEECHVH